MDDARLVAGIELGGTKAIALLARGRDIVAQDRLPTEGPASTLAALSDRLAAWRTIHGRPEALGIASFGPLVLDRADPDYGRIATTTKPGWAGCDLVGHFARTFDGPIMFDTDVAGAALAEYRWGAALGCAVAVYLTIGTGVGGGIIVDGVPLHGALHPEIGHVRVRRMAGDSFAGACPFHGDCLEGLVSGPALAARTGLAGAAIGTDHPVWHAVSHELAELAATLILTLSPQRILIGGGVVERRPELLPPIRSAVAALLNGYLDGLSPERLADMIAAPMLGELAGPLGAIALATSHRQHPPATI